MEDSINKIDAQQNSRMAVLEQQIKDLKEDVDKFIKDINLNINLVNKINDLF